MPTELEIELKAKIKIWASNVSAFIPRPQDGLEDYKPHDGLEGYKQFTDAVDQFHPPISHHRKHLTTRRLTNAFTALQKAAAEYAANPDLPFSHLEDAVSEHSGLIEKAANTLIKRYEHEKTERDEADAWKKLGEDDPPRASGLELDLSGIEGTPLSVQGARTALMFMRQVQEKMDKHREELDILGPIYNEQGVKDFLTGQGAKLPEFMAAYQASGIREPSMEEFSEALDKTYRAVVAIRLQIMGKSQHWPTMEEAVQDFKTVKTGATALAAHVKGSDDPDLQAAGKTASLVVDLLGFTIAQAQAAAKYGADIRPDFY